MTNARVRVRAISLSSSHSMYWLKAPALAEDTKTASASTASCSAPMLPPGVIAYPASAVSMMMKPMRSLNRLSTSRAVFVNPRLAI